ncbi:ferredoxin reductase [Corynebacterium pseudopelargi]|uniref:Stearoyl-CoA 9-desaturase electron transfer partner n=1 Tax=Corynebacterium pseudopelargi TaxID=2080757 RepID=A0A3G6J0Z8_9CORY|nr:ferredoxin reductase [Corynebacterium pseudopelargi]AZA09814.1 Stearoyl-CoA 9-desaturase electron transfer partner [Corynebacterium pseudopelargi]
MARSRTQDRLASMRGLLKRFTTPLLPDDYSAVLNPLWSTRELRGRIEDVRRHGDVVLLEITPGWGVQTNFKPGQYIGIGVEVDGRYVWRSYSLTNAPDSNQGRFSIAVKAVEKGKLSQHLIGTASPGTAIRIAAPAGDFYLPNPVPAKIAFITAGTGITPVISMLRGMQERQEFGQSDVVLHHSVRSLNDHVFAEVLEQFAKDIRIHIRQTSIEGRLQAEDLEQLEPDLRQREIFACGPAEMLDYWQQWAGDDVAFHSERFSLQRSSDAEGGTIEFSNGGKATAASGTTILEAGEAAGIPMPFGCRMGICHTCVRQLEQGEVIDLLSGETHESGQRVRTCVSVPKGDIRVQT